MQSLPPQPLPPKLAKVIFVGVRFPVQVKYYSWAVLQSAPCTVPRPLDVTKLTRYKDRSLQGQDLRSGPGRLHC
jgi:hypothetical protein